MNKKQFFRSVAFLLIVVLLMIGLSDLFELPNNSNYDKRLYTYRGLSEDTVDAVYIGTSGVDRYWISPKAYEEYGMTVYNYSVDAMPSWLFVNAIEAASEKQDPQLFIIDARAFGQTNTVEQMDIRARRVLDSMQYLSPNWFKAVSKTVETIREVDPEQSRLGMSYLLPFVKYHSKWAEEDFSYKKNIGSREHGYGGFYISLSLSTESVTVPYDDVPAVYDTEVRTELDPIAEQSLYELLDYAEENDIQLLFVDTPQYMNTKEMGRANTIYDILDEAGADYISYNLPGVKEEWGMEFDPEKDFYNTAHVNYYGAEKFTDGFAAYLDENYDLPDRRNDENVQEEWGGLYDKIVKRIRKLEEEKAEKAE